MDQLIVVTPEVSMGASVVEGICATYRIWYAMRKRCGDKKNKNYGGRGISVCDRWQSSFPLFLQDMGLKPGEEFSIDRKEVNGNYCPDNCRWATDLEQSRNRRKFDCCSRGHLMSENRIIIADQNVIGGERPVCRRCHLIRNWERRERLFFERNTLLPKPFPEETKGDIFDCPVCEKMIPMQKVIVDQIRKGSCVVTCEDNQHFLAFIDCGSKDEAIAAVRRKERGRKRAQAARDAARGDKPKYKKQIFASHCKRGHALEGENLYFYDTPWGKQSRCRACQKMRNDISRGKKVEGY